MKEKMVEGLENRPGIAAGLDSANWQKAFTDGRTQTFAQKANAIVYRTSFVVAADDLKGTVTFFYNRTGKQQSVCVNGKEAGKDLSQNNKEVVFKLNAAMPKAGSNSIAILQPLE